MKYNTINVIKIISAYRPMESSKEYRDIALYITSNLIRMRRTHSVEKSVSSTN